MSRSNRSIIFYSGFREKSYCGYCKKDNSSCSYGMWASCLTVQAYQDLIDRGWRRSGKYCYKSAMDKTCCPLYTIRCEALDLQLSKSQKKIIKKVTKFLQSGECDKSAFCIEQAERESFVKFESHDTRDHDDKMQVYVEEKTTSVNKSQNSKSLVVNKEDNNMVMSSNLSGNSETLKTKQIKPGKGADPNLPRCKKKKVLRIEKKLAKNPNAVIKTSAILNKSLEDFIAENEEVQKLRIKLLKLTPSCSSFEAEYAVYQLYQTSVHGDTDDRCTREQFIRFLVNSPLIVSLVKTGSDAFAQTFTAGYSLFAKYQMAVHNDKPDDCDVEQYIEFLVDSPLQAEKADHPDHPGYGSFHQQYWLDDKLIAVGVIDILPKCVSSVYLFYDPDYYHMVLGTYSSLREICLVRQLHNMSPDLKYYYMGFYIHSCPKMRYKAQFRPSYLLCPLRNTWHEIHKCIQRLDNEKYSILNESIDTQDDNDTLRIENILVLHSGSLMDYSTYKRIENRENQDELLTEYANLVGPDLAGQLIYCFMD